MLYADILRSTNPDPYVIKYYLITFIRYTYVKRLESKLIKMSLEANKPKALYSIATICLMEENPG
jgi:hypothetical protein